MNKIHLLGSARNALTTTLLVSLLGISTFFAFEPSISRSANPHNFTVTQQITGEISFLLEAADVSMTGFIQGLTGGYATGTTVAVVNTNNATGYSMTLGFSNVTAMHLPGGSNVINDYSQAGAAPDYRWVDNASGGAAEFGYTVTGSTASEIDSSFMDNNAACGAGTNETANRCWASPASTSSPEQIINSSAPNGSSTTTLTFKVAVPNNPSPALPTGYYVATGTLTATNNP